MKTSSISETLASSKEITYAHEMITGRITSKAQTTVPRAVRLALGIGPGDNVVWEVEGQRVLLTRAKPASEPIVSNFATFTEWAGDADCKAFDNH
jgi:antitoxin PrlF